MIRELSFGPTSVAAALFMAVGLLCLLWPDAIQRVALKYSLPGGLGREFMEGRGYILMLRLIGIVSTAVALLLVAALMTALVTPEPRAGAVHSEAMPGIATG